MSAAQVRQDLAAVANAGKAKVMAGFFKTGKGQYGEGDQFIGVTVPAQRLVARAHQTLEFRDIAALLDSGVHEHRLTALLILVRQYERGDEAQKQKVFDFYLAHLAGVNNWDLVDSTARQIVGTHLMKRDRRLLYRLVKSKVLWERRLAMIATHAFISEGESKDAFALAEALLGDTHDLMHKAVGWMLREVGDKVGEPALRGFLKQHAATMPRTALRYAIEHYPPAERKAWLAKK